MKFRCNLVDQCFNLFRCSYNTYHHQYNIQFYICFIPLPTICIVLDTRSDIDKNNKESWTQSTPLWYSTNYICPIWLSISYYKASLWGIFVKMFVTQQLRVIHGLLGTKPCYWSAKTPFSNMYVIMLSFIRISIIVTHTPVILNGSYLVGFELFPFSCASFHSCTN